MRNLNSMDPQMSTEVSKKGELITSAHSHPSTSRARDGEAQREWARVRLDQRPTCRQNALLLSLPPFQRTVCVHTLCIARGDRGRHTACTHLRYRQGHCLGNSKHSADHQSVCIFTAPPATTGDGGVWEIKHRLLMRPWR